jgi:hypothetical protein
MTDAKRKVTADAIHVGLSVPSEHVTALRRLAQENDRSLSAEVRLAIRAWLDADSEPSELEPAA